MTTKICALPGCEVEFETKTKQPGQKYCSRYCGYRAKQAQDAKRDKKVVAVKCTYSARGAVDANPNAFNVNASADQKPRMLVIPLPTEKGAK